MEQGCKRPLVILTGPTAVGKTELSIKLAKAIGGEIISADSMQVYKGMDIGTAKITEDEMQGVKHYLVDCFEPKDDFNIVVFQRMAKEAMEEIYATGKIPIIVGGTGFYIQSVLYDIEFEDDGSEDESENEYRAKMRQLAYDKGSEYLHNMLREVDPESADAIHHNNIKRVIRALEYYEQTGRKISEHNKEQQQKESPYNFMYFVLNDEREVLYERIDKRVDIMFDAGLEKEVKALIDSGLTKDNVSMQGIGYKEMFGYFDGEYDIERAKYLIKLDTRHFAKRQLTWFRREQSVEWINYYDYNSDKDAMLEAMIDKLKSRQIVE